MEASDAIIANVTMNVPIEIEVEDICFDYKIGGYLWGIPFQNEICWHQLFCF